MKRPTNGNIEKGFTLVEVMVSLAAMAIGLVILWGMHFTSLNMQRSDQQRSDALRLGAALMDFVRPDNATVPGTDVRVVCKLAGCNDTTYNSRFYTLPERNRFQNATVDVGWQQIPLTTTWEARVTVQVLWKERINLLGGGASTNKRAQSVRIGTVYVTH